MTKNWTTCIAALLLMAANVVSRKRASLTLPILIGQTVSMTGQMRELIAATPTGSSQASVS